MLLNDIGKSPDSTFRKINQHLEANYGFKIAEDVSDRDLVAIMEQIEGEITDLKIKGDDAKVSPEISKRLLVLEGIKTLREFAIMQFQSPDLERVLTGMTDFVVNHFTIGGMHHADFEESIRDAMKQYRSSKYRFPDDLVEQRVRQGAMSKIQALSNPAPAADGSSVNMETILGEEDDDMKGFDIDENIFSEDWGNTPMGSRVRDTAHGGHAASIPNTKQAAHAMKVLDNPELSLEPMKAGPHTPATKEPIPMIRDKHGRMVPDPFAAQKAARAKGIVMKENLVKNLRRLLETEVSQAEVMMAAKGFAQELQEMVEKIGRLQNEDLPPVVDQMRETYGQESAAAFQTQIYGAMQGVMDALFTAKTQVDDAVSNMASTGQFTAQTDMDLPVDGMDSGMDDPTAMDADLDADASMDADLDNIAGDLEAEDEFGGAAEEEPLGRAMKTESLRVQVARMQKLVEKARKLRGYQV